MKRTFVFLILCILFSVSANACAALKTGDPTVLGPVSETDPTQEPTEYGICENPTAPSEDAGNKEVLALEDYRNNPVSVDFEEGSLLEMKHISISHTVLHERKESLYDGEKELDILVQYIQDTLNVEINSNWKVLVHYYDGDQTVGMVQFVYTVGEINTNRSILFNINGDKYDTVYYKCLTGEFDEADLADRVEKFKSKYTQGKRQLQEGESFCEDQTAFTYFIHSQKLVYSYAYFFRYDIGVINNDWGTVRVIDAEGNALRIP